LDFTVTDSVTGISIRIPKGLSENQNLLSSTNLEDIRVFMTTDSSFVMSIHKGAQLSASSYRQAFAAPDSTMQNKLFKVRNKATFQVNGLEVNQYLMESPDLINFKLVVYGEAESAIEINYLVKRSEYKLIVKQIESSIGSLVKRELILTLLCHNNFTEYQVDSYL